MAANGESKKQYEQIQLSSLSIQQLQQLKMEFESEINVLQDSMQTLKVARNKLTSSKEALEQIKPEWQNKEVLVPLTGSMYVPGIVKDIDSFTIDIGTGYYVEMNLEASKNYFKRKVDYLQEQIEKIDQIGLQKTSILNAVMDIIELKVTEIMKHQQATSAS